MLNFEELEKKCKKYQLKQTLKYLFPVFLFFFLIIGGYFYINFNDTKAQQKHSIKINKINQVKHIKKPQNLKKTTSKKQNKKPKKEPKKTQPPKQPQQSKEIQQVKTLRVSQL
jgi:hypothetical protein